MIESRVLVADGTFRAASNLFSQVYIIQFQLGQFTLPAVYSLLQHKAIELNLQFKPQEILIDFENGMIETIKAELPETKIVGCFFDFTQSIIRNLGKFEKMR